MKRRIAHLLLALIAPCTVAGCPPTPAPDPPPTPTPVPASCATVCANGASMHCNWAEPTPAGAPCVDVCQAAQDFGEKWNLECRTNAASCAAADGCE